MAYCDVLCISNNLHCWVRECSNVGYFGNDISQQFGSFLCFSSSFCSIMARYGDVSVIDSNLDHPRWHVLMGILYMIMSMVVLVTAISAVISSTGNPLDRINDWAMDYFVRSVEKEKFLYQLIHRSYIVKISIIAIQFLGLNLIGVLLARIFVSLSEEETEQWTWMTTFYWAIQTTTTIGVRLNGMDNRRSCYWR